MLVEPAQVSLHLPERLAALRLRLSPDQVPQTLGRRQVQLAPAERPQRELTRLGGTEPRNPAWGAGRDPGGGKGEGGAGRTLGIPKGSRNKGSMK